MQHEGGLRHKGNKERYIRNLYKTGMKKKQDSEEEKRTMKFVEAAAQAAFAQDVSSGSTSASRSTTASTSKPKPASKPADPFANYSTAQSLGITDPDAELEAAEELKKNEGAVGEWVSVVPPPPPLPEKVDPAAATASSSAETETNVVGQIRKRDEGSVDEEDTRQFKLRRKTVAVGLGEIYDPGVIKVKPRTENEETPSSANEPATSSYPSLSAGTEKPVWVSRGWKKAGELTSTSSTSISYSSAEISLGNSIKKEEEKLNIEDSSEPTTDLPKLPEPESLQKDADQAVLKDSEIKKEEELNITLVKSEPDASKPGLFRKRKVPVNSGAGKRRDR